MLGNRPGFAALLKKEVPTLKVTHCMIYRQILASKSMEDVFDICIKMVNFIRKHDTNHRIFQSFYDKIGLEHYILLYHPDMWWLSRGRVVTHFFKLRETINLFLQYRNSDLIASLENNEFIQRAVYIADVMYHLN